MKYRKIIALMFALMFSVGIVSGCSNNVISKIYDISENERTERQWVKLLKAYQNEGYSLDYMYDSIKAIEYFPDSKKILELKCENVELLPEPAVSYNSSKKTGAITLSFKCDEKSLTEGTPSAYLYVAVDNEMSTDELSEIVETQGEKGIYVKPYPFSDEFNVVLSTPGEHNVRALIVNNEANGGNRRSPEYKYKHKVKGSRYTKFGFLTAPGTYKKATEVRFEGNEEASIYYTINGKDPYDFESGRMVNATEFKDKIRIGSGFSVVKARCISNGIISPLLEGQFIVDIPFDAGGRNVGESTYYDYIAFENAGLNAYDKRTNEFIEIIDNKVGGVAVNVRGTSSVAKENPSVLEGRLHPEAILQYKEEGECVDIWYTNYEGYVKKLTYVDDRLAKESFHTKSYLPSVMGGHWVGMEWMSDEPQTGSSDVVSKAYLMTEKLAVYGNGKDNKWWACNADGTNERVILEEASIIKTYDALAGTKLLFRKEDDSHWILDIETGEMKENTSVPTDKGEFLGYSSSAVYFYNGSIVRVPMDFTVL